MKNKKLLLLIIVTTFLLIYLIPNLPTNSNNYSPITNRVGFDLKNNAENQTATQLNGTFVCYHEISVYKFVEQNVTFNYTDATTNQTLEGASANFTWYKKNNPSINGNGNLTELGSGLYTLDFNTSTRDIGEYILSVYIKKENFTNPNMVVSMTIRARSTTFLTLAGTMLQLERGTVFPLLFYLEDSINGTRLDGLNIKWTMGFLTDYLFSIGNGFYILPFPTGIFDIGSNLIIFDGSSNTNYNIATSSINIDVTWEKILGIDLPIFYAIIIISIIIVVCVLIYLLHRRLSVPYPIRKIDSSLKKIENQERPISVLDLRSKDEIFQELFEKEWELLNKKPKTGL